MSEQNKYTFKDFKSDQEIRWCPGCGDSAILNAVQKTMADLDHNKEDYAVVSGIGCSSRFPYYMDTYGFHGIHGRAGALASGVKVANPRLSVWQITGDGDAMAIGGNHFIHEIRRNVDLNIILFNNEIYGLTKGQYSPTSKYGKVTKTSPFGTVEYPFNPGELTIGSHGKFFARTTDNNINQMVEVFTAAEKHRGTSVIEVLQNCVIYNNNVHSEVTDKDKRDDNQIYLEHGKPMIYGSQRNKGLVLDGLKLKSVTIGEDGITEADILIHDAFEPSSVLHTMLIKMAHPDLPVAMGVIRSVVSATYDAAVEKQIEWVKESSKIKNMTDVLFGGNTWTV